MADSSEDSSLSSPSLAMNGVPQPQQMAAPPASAAGSSSPSSITATGSSTTTGFGYCMHRAVILNNQGVVLLQQGDFTDAIQTLNDALRLIDCAVESSKNQNNNNNNNNRQAEAAMNRSETADMMTRRTVCILRMEEPVGGGGGGRGTSSSSEAAPEEGVMSGEDHHAVTTTTTGTRPVSVVPLTDEASEVMDVELVTSIIFFNISLSYSTRAAHQQQHAKMMGDHQMALRLSETGWSILSGRLALATNSDNGGGAAEPYLAMAEKILHQMIELHEEQQLGTDCPEEESNTILGTYYDLLECVLHSLTMVESIQDMEKEAAAGAA